ncbi:sugar ABC transporter permease [Brachybacterium halotolerans subsp. kimchii]|uniref:carbohydrate ABC transporter permease n=1 Tax=Brachybacterium halotolerans TaxID=2795215 RepID=UPI001E444B4C|nr:sugar ABC transporter permease [Brachybacterium halotolerans]UEJ81923.1 sugar ABC transporter permease [Brachybacterium halotolerans subsp. kimchii]
MSAAADVNADAGPDPGQGAGPGADPSASAAPGPRTRGGGRGRGRARSRAQRETRAALFFLAPDAIGLLVFVAIPMALSVVLGFFWIDGFGNFEFIGIDNYVRMVKDPQFWNSARVTLLYLVVLVPLIYVVGLGLALLVQQRFPAVGIIRSALFLPYVISIVVVAMVWQFMLTDRTGVIASLLSVVGLDGISFLGDPRFALGTVIAVTVWLQMGYYMIIFLAGLQDIPGELYEAARIDGASAWQRLRRITLPLLAPTSFFVLLTSMVAVVTGGLDMIFVLTSGGPANSTSLLIFYIYQQAFLFGDLGYAAAVGSVLVAFLLLFSGAMFLLTRGGRFSHDD